MTHSMILTEQRGRVAIVKFNRPDMLNAMHPTMTNELYTQVEAWNQDKSVGAIVVSGEGKGFCAGADVTAWAKNAANGAGGERRGGNTLNRWIELATTSKPIIAAINGVAVGWGLTMSMICDVRVASTEGRMSARFIRAGVTPELGSSAMLAKIVGWGRAMEMMQTARLYNADECLQMGLVTHVYAHDKLIAEAVKLADEIAFNPTQGLADVKRLLWATVHDNAFDKVLAREAVALSEAMKRLVFKEATQAFIERRQPDFHKEGME